MIPNTSSQSVFAPAGTLRVYPQEALVISETNVIGPHKLFCKARLGAGVQESVVDTKHDRNPKWNQELGFRRTTESLLKIEVFHKNLFGLIGPTAIGECGINLDPVFMQGQVTVKTDLVYKQKRVGSFQVRLKWEPDGGARPMSQQYSPNYLVNNPPPLVFSGTNLNPGNMASQPMFAPSFAPQQMPGQQQSQPQPQFFMVRPQSAGPQQIVVNPGVAPSMGVNFGGDYNVNVKQSIIKKKEAVKEEPIDPNLPDEAKCVICLEKKKEGAFYRCGHSCCCTGCGMTFIGKPCPICRQIVGDFIKVYDA